MADERLRINRTQPVLSFGFCLNNFSYLVKASFTAVKRKNLQKSLLTEGIPMWKVNFHTKKMYLLAQNEVPRFKWFKRVRPRFVKSAAVTLIQSTQLISTYVRSFSRYAFLSDYLIDLKLHRTK